MKQELQIEKWGKRRYRWYFDEKSEARKREMEDSWGICKQGYGVEVIGNEGVDGRRGKGDKNYHRR